MEEAKDAVQEAFIEVLDKNFKYKNYGYLTQVYQVLADGVHQKGAIRKEDEDKSTEQDTQQESESDAKQEGTTLQSESE